MNTTALVGAWIWKIIAVVFNYELGLIAWAIGGMVGYAALAMGSRGQLCGIVCAVLALVSIMGGKFMAVGDLLEQELDMLAAQVASEEYQAVLKEQETAARYYVQEVNSDEDLRAFMVDYGYSEQYSPDLVAPHEIEDFRTNVAPMLDDMADGDFDMAAWIRRSFEKEMENVSTWDLVKDSLGLMDIAFLFLGVATAFKLGSGGLKS